MPRSFRLTGAAVPIIVKLYLLSGGSLGYSSDTIYLPDEGRVVTALANRIYRFEETSQSTTEPIISSSHENVPVLRAMATAIVERSKVKKLERSAITLTLACRPGYDASPIKIM
jgi:hypothetical protein